MTEWQPIETAPYGKVVEVRNDCMKFSVRATRGYVVPETGFVHENQNYFTTQCTKIDEFEFMGAGKLACPSEWREL